MYQQSRINGIQFEWTVHSMIEREENWLRSQIRNNNNNIRGNRYISFIVRSDFDNYRLRRRRNFDNEPNFSFFQGMLIGFLLNIFTIFFFNNYCFSFSIRRKFY